MKSLAMIAALSLLAACSGPAPVAGNADENKVEDVAANQMAPDEVTDVPDDSASAEPGGPAELNASNGSVPEMR